MTNLSANGPSQIDPTNFSGKQKLFGILPFPQFSPSESKESRYAIILLSPSLFLIFVLVVIPIIFAFYLSIHKIEFVGGNVQLVPYGLRNYARLLSDSRFLPTLGRSLWFTVFRVALSVSIGLSLALLLNETSTVARILNRVFLIPWALSFVVNGLMWKWMYDSNYGIFNFIFLKLGIIDSNRSWLGDPSTALGAVIIMEAWKAIPFVALVLLSGLKSIPEELYESAKVDGADVFQRFWHISLTGLRPVLLVVLVTQTMWSVLAFASIWPTTQGGPADATMLLNIYAYQQSFMYLNLGYGSALAFVITFIILMLTLAYLTTLRIEE